MTPPCAGQLIEAGVRRVVAALVDPDPRVDGRGFAQLRAAGVEVTVGPGAAAAERLNAPFLTWQRLRRPLVSLKAAQSLDGLIAARHGRSQWISGAAARRVARRLRGEHDAVLVGAGTARADDPRLTVRLPAALPPPLRVVLSGSLDLPAGLRLFQDGAAPTRVYTCAAGPARIGTATVVRLPVDEHGLALGAVLADLAAIGVRSLLVEGGGTTLAAFLRLCDRAYLFVADRLLGAEGATPLLRVTAAAAPEAGFALEAVTRVPLGRDWLVAGRLAPPAAASA
jgi:diaminohydroxyphosphoribosylaminopyrimidine deaminase/5-amino-6-(5-phosphoribosylamino)uracil reductase